MAPVGSDLYHSDAVWAEGLISAAKAVASATKLLVGCMFTSPLTLHLSSTLYVFLYLILVTYFNFPQLPTKQFKVKSTRPLCKHAAKP